MNPVKYLFLTAFLACVALSAYAHESGKALPTPQTVSQELQTLIGAKPFPYWNDPPKTAQDWKQWASALNMEGTKGLAELREHLGVSVTQENFGGVPVFILTLDVFSIATCNDSVYFESVAVRCKESLEAIS